MQQVIVVDDSTISLQVCKRILSQLRDVEVHPFVSPMLALPWVCEHDVDLVVVDYRMPEMDGIEFIDRFRKMSHDQNVPIIVLTGHSDAALRRRALELGASDFLQKPADPIEFLARTRNLLRLRKAESELSRRADTLAGELAAKTTLVTAQERAMLASLIRTASYHDNDGMPHGARISDYADMIARNLSLDRATRHILSIASPLHDIGNVGISDAILRRTGKLDRDEFEIVKTHARIGFDILRGSPSALMQMAAEIALSHHERWDGRGYPRGIAGKSIPLCARIVAVADVFDALVSARPYKAAWPLPEALAAIRRGAGEAFDPAAVDAFLADEMEIQDIRSRHQTKAA